MWSNSGQSLCQLKAMSVFGGLAVNCISMTFYLAEFGFDISHCSLDLKKILSKITKDTGFNKKKKRFGCCVVKSNFSCVL